MMEGWALFFAILSALAFIAGIAKAFETPEK